MMPRLSSVAVVAIAGALWGAILCHSIGVPLFFLAVWLTVVYERRWSGHCMGRLAWELRQYGYKGDFENVLLDTEWTIPDDTLADWAKKYGWVSIAPPRRRRRRIRFRRTP